MPTISSKIVTYRMTIADSYDAVLRVLTDAQRFGLDLINLNLRPTDKGQELTIALSFTAAIDCQLLALRFGRHPTVLHVDGSANAFDVDAA